MQISCIFKDGLDRQAAGRGFRSEEDKEVGSRVKRVVFNELSPGRYDAL